MVTRAGHCRQDACDVYVGRPSFWGNPFIRRGAHSKFTDVQEVDDPIASYEAHVRSHPDMMARLPELRGRVLGCWCVRLKHTVPMKGQERCHAQVLARMAEET